ncbi:hypothetical protein CsSME_00029896 [Camellia sinensis var. sinensis]
MDLDVNVSVICFFQGHSLGGLRSWRLYFDVDRIHGFLGVLLERHLITAISNRNSISYVTLITMAECGRGGGRRGRPRRQEMPMHDDISAQEEGVG